MIYYIKDADILKDRSEIIINPTNTEGVMGAGLAQQFAWRFPGLEQGYTQACKRGDIRIGGPLFRWYTHNPTANGPKVIFCLPTKDKWRNPSQLLYVELGLKQLANELLAYETERTILEVSLPALGCGLGQLKWGPVRELLELHLNPLALKFNIFVHLPQERGVSSLTE